MNTAVPIKEMIHRLFKAIIPHSNKKNIELDFMQHHNTLQTLRYLLDGGIDSRYYNVTQFNFKKLSKDQCVRSLLGSWYISTSQLEHEPVDDSIFNGIIFIYLFYIKS